MNNKNILIKCIENKKMSYMFSVGSIYEIIPVLSRYNIKDNQGLFWSDWSYGIDINKQIDKNEILYHLNNWYFCSGISFQIIN